MLRWHRRDVKGRAGTGILENSGIESLLLLYRKQLQAKRTKRALAFLDRPRG